MSRIGKKPILIPEGVEVKIEGQRFSAKGPKGEISRQFPAEIGISIEENKISVAPRFAFEKTKARPIQIKKIKSLWGTTRAVLNNIIKGVKEGFEKKLEIEGLGFKAVASPEGIELFIGFAHSVKIKAPEGVKISVEKNIISVSGADFGKVSLLAAQIKRAKPPEPYKGKGIRYSGEVIRRKVGKKAVAASGGAK